MPCFRGSSTQVESPGGHLIESCSSNSSMAADGPLFPARMRCAPRNRHCGRHGTPRPSFFTKDGNRTVHGIHWKANGACWAAAVWDCGVRWAGGGKQWAQSVCHLQVVCVCVRGRERRETERTDWRDDGIARPGHLAGTWPDTVQLRVRESR